MAVRRRDALVVVCVCLVSLISIEAARRRRPEEADFEFEEEAKTLGSKEGGIFTGKERTQNPFKNREESELCQALRCSKSERCFVKNPNEALCVDASFSGKESRIAEATENDDDLFTGTLESAEVSSCPVCPNSKSRFVCGSDNRTYSSACRLHYHNCIQKTTIQLACKGFCPCATGIKQKENNKTHQHWNAFVSKYKMTVKNNSNTVQSQYSSTPQKENKYSNKYWKNADGNPPLAEDKHRQKGHNSVLTDKLSTVASAEKIGCSPYDLEVLGRRLFDWFSVVMTDAKKKKNSHRSRGLHKALFPVHCAAEVQWIFLHSDANGDGWLAAKELHLLERETKEQCMKQFIEKCDRNEDTLLSGSEWCSCFEIKEKPCLSAKIHLRTDLLGGYVPECDVEGYYKRTQCHASTGLCWCVDKHGVEYANTRMHTKPDCDALIGHLDSSDDDDEDDDDDDDNEEGSADRPLVI